MNKGNKNQKAKKQVLPNQAMLFLRGLIGVYLIHQAIELIRDESQTVPRMGIMIFAVIFIIGGAGIVLLVIRSFMKGEYVGGKADISQEEDYTEYEEDLEDSSSVTEDVSEENIMQKEE